MKLISIIAVIFNMVVFDAAFSDYVIIILTVVVFLVGVLTFFCVIVGGLGSNMLVKPNSSFV